MHRLHRGASELSLVRDQLTRAAYAYFALWGWFLYSFGPTVPLLRHEEGTSRAVAGLHGTALAAGSLLSATISVPLARRFGRRRVVLLACLLVALGIVLLVSLRGPALTVPATLVIGLGGALGLNAVNPILADHHGERGAGAIGEANAIATACGILGPLAIGAGVALGLTWRGATVLTLPLAATAVWLLSRAPNEPALVVPGRRPAALGAETGGDTAVDDQTGLPALEVDRGVPPVAFWLAWLVMVACVAVEFCTTFWAPDQLRGHAGLGADTASAAISGLLVGMTIGRVLAVPLTARFSVSQLLSAAIGVSLVGWFVLWTATSLVVGVLGLALMGLGLALQFPLSLVRTMDASGGRPDVANALASVGTGLASGLAPFALGALADRVGVHSGFLLVPGLLLAAGVLLALGQAPVRGRTPLAGRARSPLR